MAFSPIFDGSKVGENIPWMNYPNLDSVFFFWQPWLTDVSAKISISAAPSKRGAKGKLETLQIEGPLSHYRSWARSRCLVGGMMPLGRIITLGWRHLHMVTLGWVYVFFSTELILEVKDWDDTWCGCRPKAGTSKMEVLFSNMLCK